MSAALPHVAARHHGPPHVICGATRMAGIQHGGGHAPASIVDGGILPQRPSTKVLTLLGAFAIVSTRRPPNAVGARRDRNRLRTSLANTPGSLNGVDQGVAERPCPNRPLPGSLSAAMYTSGARVRQCPYRASACWLASSRPRSRTTAAPRLEGGS